MRSGTDPWPEDATFPRVPLASVTRLLQTGPFGSQLGAEDYVEGGIPIINPSHITEKGLRPDPSVAVSVETRTRLSRHALQAQDVVFVRRGELGRASLVGAHEAGWICGTGSLLARLRLEMIEPQFMAYVTQCERARSWLTRQSVGSTMDNLNATIVGRLPVPLPSLPTQRRIVSFLTMKSAAIDALIAKKERLLELLVEKRQAFITQCVTEGLHLGVPMKESGIPWIDRIPSHWDVERVRFLFRERNELPLDGDGIVTAFRDGQVALRERRRADGFMLADKEVGYQHVRAGDLVVHSMDAFAGAIGVAEDDGKCTPEYVVLVPSVPSASNVYFATLFRVMAQRDFIFVMCPSVRERAPRIRFITLRDMFVPVPPPNEQNAIASVVAKTHRDTQPALASLRASITRLREYRQALISAAVTGQLDVTRAEAPKRKKRGSDQTELELA